MVKIGDKLYLMSASGQGRKVLDENGATWIVLEVRDRVLGLGQKPGMLLESLLTGVWIWVKIEKDKNFSWNIVLGGRSKR